MDIEVRVATQPWVWCDFLLLPQEGGRNMADTQEKVSTMQSNLYLHFNYQICSCEGRTAVLDMWILLCTVEKLVLRDYPLESMLVAFSTQPSTESENTTCTGLTSVLNVRVLLGTAGKLVPRDYSPSRHVGGPTTNTSTTLIPMGYYCARCEDFARFS